MSEAMKVPMIAPLVLTAARERHRQAQVEVSLLAELVNGYVRALGLEPSKNYSFRQEGNEMFAEEIPLDMPE